MTPARPVRGTRRKIALVTSRPQPLVPLDPDLPGLHRALLAADADTDTDVVCWDDPDLDWAGYDLAVIRSPWDYTLRTEAFLAWADRCAGLTTLANPPGVVRWNADKRYLGELAAAGVPVVPTRYLAPGTDGADELPGGGAAGDAGYAGGGGADAVDDGYREYVIKPTTGAGARMAARYRLGDPRAAASARRHLASLHETGMTAMVQPYQRRIDTTGERALIFWGGSLLHAIRKGPVLAAGGAHDARKVAHPDPRPWEPTAAELAVAELALKAVPCADTRELLYGRVDLVDGDDGEPLVMELELVEPNLFLFVHPQSLPIVVAGILGRANAVSRRHLPAATDPR